MLTKLLLTVAVVLAAYTVLRARRTTSDARAAPAAGSGIPWGVVRLGAYGLIGVILLASAWSVYHQWQRGREVLEVQVVNPATGASDHYQARRSEIKGRVFRTLNGQQVRIAEFERLILSEPR
ncbi:hypothetical protein [Rhabdochromatium marinum]|uniref:hypothetical protein n=1 Tax=Rhabdochromatium marinum TaxID=48729 RepID=UPI0019089B37|nr:hypothetical protein [Rhabdochromatium marinum]MBK1647717.1 hypothetical protein [Rhabdochromatium marinum]